MVDAVEEFERPVGESAGEVAGAIEARPVDAEKGSGTKLSAVRPGRGK